MSLLPEAVTRRWSNDQEAPSIAGPFMVITAKSNVSVTESAQIKQDRDLDTRHLALNQTA